MTTELNNPARHLMQHRTFGVLSTHSLAVPGYPFGSITPYCLDYSGQPIILISDIAQHTKNIKQDPKVSLTIVDKETNNVQTGARLTLLANAILSEDEESAHRYYQHFPESITYHQTHDFNFYQLQVVRGRFIGGFGKIFWHEPDEFLQSNPFRGKEERYILDHMNEDHQNALRHYCRYFKDVDISDEEQLKMIGIDAEGFEILSNENILRIDFKKAIQTTQEARKVLVEMAKAGS